MHRPLKVKQWHPSKLKQEPKSKRKPKPPSPTTNREEQPRADPPDELSAQFIAGPPPDAEDPLPITGEEGWWRVDLTGVEDPYAGFPLIDDIMKMAFCSSTDESAGDGLNTPGPTAPSGLQNDTLSSSKDSAIAMEEDKEEGISEISPSPERTKATEATPDSIPDRQVDLDDLPCGMPTAAQNTGPADASSPPVLGGEDLGNDTPPLPALDPPSAAAAEVETHSQQEEHSDSADHGDALDADHRRNVVEPTSAASGAKRVCQIEESDGEDHQKSPSRRRAKRRRLSTAANSVFPRRLESRDAGSAPLNAPAPCVTSYSSPYHNTARKSNAMGRSRPQRRRSPRRGRGLTPTALPPTPPESYLSGGATVMSSRSRSLPSRSDACSPLRPRPSRLDQKASGRLDLLEALIEIHRITSSLLGELVPDRHEALTDEDTDSHLEGEDDLSRRFTNNDSDEESNDDSDDDSNDDSGDEGEYIEASRGDTRRGKAQRRRWTESEEDRLRRLKNADKLSDSKIARILDRTESAIDQHWRIMCKRDEEAAEAGNEISQ